MIDRDPESFYYDEELNAELAEVRIRTARRKIPTLMGTAGPMAGPGVFRRPGQRFLRWGSDRPGRREIEGTQKRKDPFFFGLGYFRPHLPFVAPKKYWDLYDRNILTPAPNPFLPENAPPFAMNSSYELTACYDLEWVKHPAVEKLPEETARLLNTDTMPPSVMWMPVSEN